MTGSANKTEQPPAWNVIAVFDPDSSGSGFAYTDGLAADGFPELHVWSQPTDGVDPGVGFKLSAEDMAAVLSGCAKRILTGELHLGDKFTEEFDASQSTGRFTLTGPVDPATVDAFRLSPDTKVITLPWSLQRPPEGPRIEVDEQTATTILDTARTWTGRIARLGASNEDLLAVQNATVDTTQRFGPWTSVVRAASIAVRADADLSAFELGLGAATVRSQVLATLALVNAAARLVGRSDVLVEVASQATADTLEVLTSASDFASRFPGDSDDPDEAALVMEAVQHSLSSALTLAYSAWALADVLDLEVFQTATGLLEAAFADEDDASWFERPEVKELLDSAAQLPTETASRLTHEVQQAGFDLDMALWWARVRLAMQGQFVPFWTPAQLDGTPVAQDEDALDGFTARCVAAALEAATRSLTEEEYRRLADLKTPWANAAS